jgi:hypothetical protein
VISKWPDGIDQGVDQIAVVVPPPQDDGIHDFIGALVEEILVKKGLKGRPHVRIAVVVESHLLHQMVRLEAEPACDPPGVSTVPCVLGRTRPCSLRAWHAGREPHRGCLAQVGQAYPLLPSRESDHKQAQRPMSRRRSGSPSVLGRAVRKDEPKAVRPAQPGLGPATPTWCPTPFTGGKP